MEKDQQHSIYRFPGPQSFLLLRSTNRNNCPSTHTTDSSPHARTECELNIQVRSLASHRHHLFAAIKRRLRSQTIFNGAPPLPNILLPLSCSWSVVVLFGIIQLQIEIV